jgi:nitrogen fixation-related uncharacterized protein
VARRVTGGPLFLYETIPGAIPLTRVGLCGGLWAVGSPGSDYLSLFLYGAIPLTRVGLCGRLWAVGSPGSDYLLSRQLVDPH